MSQPIGIFPFPAGLLLVPEGDATLEAAATELRAGRLPDHWPQALRVHELAHLGRFEDAAAAISDADPFATYNRWLLEPTSAPAAVVAASLPPMLAALVELVRFTNGETDEPPRPTTGSDPLLAALILAAWAAAELGHGRPDAALEHLGQAVSAARADSPVLAAILLGNAAAVRYEQLGDSEGARAELATALTQLADTDLVVNRAELHYQLGTIEHEQAAACGQPLQAAMHHYYTALQLITVDDAPYLWASVQMNLSAAYLASPMAQASDQLRMGIAIQALRAALEVFDREQHPAEWSTATVNLAGALVYTPSVKQGDNLVEAVELYEQVLELRGRDRDPIGRARVLASQGNALAHLGIFDQAKAKLYEARFLFEEQLDHDSVMAVRSVLDEIAKQTTPEGGRDGSGRLAMAGVDGSAPVTAANADPGLPGE